MYSSAMLLPHIFLVGPPNFPKKIPALYYEVMQLKKNDAWNNSAVVGILMRIIMAGTIKNPRELLVLITGC